MLRNVSIKRKGLLLISLPIVMTVTLLAMVYQIGGALETTLRWTMHSQEVLRVIEEASGGLLAIHGENLQRALLDSGETQFEIQERVDEVHSALTRLRDLVTDNPRQTAVADQFVPRSESLLAELATTQTELRAGHRAAGSARAAREDRELQAVTLLGDELRAEERALVVERLTRAGQISLQRRVTLIAGGPTIVFFVLLLGWSLLHSMMRRMLVIRENVHLFAGDQELTPHVRADDEIGQIDQAVHDMVRALRAQQRDNEMFIYSVSHDLRSPLVNLQGFSKELAKSTQALRDQLRTDAVPVTLRQSLQTITDEEMPEALHFIDLAVQRQARIIDSLLSLSRAGRVEYHWTKVDLQARCQELVAERSNHAAPSGVEFVLGQLPPVEGDRDALERLFDNLLSNAVKYLSPERPGRIEIGHLADANGSVYFVRDNGIGIAPENLKRAFLPFSRFSGGEGEGIGLSLVRRIVDRHHGRVWLESELGIGTTVFVSLPKTRFAPPANATVQPN